MRKIRIGNDIRLKLKIEPNTKSGEFDKIDEFDQSSVKQLRCYLINTSYNKPTLDEMHPKPFLRTGFPQFYRPTACNINNAGFSSYHIQPANLCNYDRFEPDFHGFHWWPGYRGFGLHPEHFHDHCPHLQYGMRPKPFCQEIGDCCTCCDEPFIHQSVDRLDPPCSWPYHPANEPYDIYGRPAEDHRHPSICNPIYLADSQVLNEKNTLTCMFPAVQQGLCGTYKLVVVLTVFEQGWGRHNLRTYTVDKGDIFELVDDETGESGNIYINVDSTGKRENLIDSLYTEHETYTIATESEVPVGGLDLYDNVYNIYMTLKDGSLVIYDGKNPNLGQLVFTSGDEEILKVGKDGTLYGLYYTGQEASRQTTVSISDIDGNVHYNFTVIVKKIDSIRIGFDPESDVQLVRMDSANFCDFDTHAVSYTVHNPEDGRYLYLFSQRRIHYVQSLDDNDDLVSQLSSGIRVPIMNAVIKDNRFCYRSVAPILAGKMKFKIVFA